MCMLLALARKGQIKMEDINHELMTRDDALVLDEAPASVGVAYAWGN